MLRIFYMLFLLLTIFLSNLLVCLLLLGCLFIYLFFWTELGPVSNCHKAPIVMLHAMQFTTSTTWRIKINTVIFYFINFKPLNINSNEFDIQNEVNCE